MLRPSVCLFSECDVCIVGKQCVLEQKLLLTAYRTVRTIVHEESIGTKMSDLDLCLAAV